MDFELSEEQLAYQSTARSFAEKEMAPFAAEWDRKSYFPKEVLLKAGELGFGGIYIDPELGGSGLSRLDGAIIFEELAAACPSTTAYLSIHHMVASMIDKFAKEPLRKKYLPDMCTAKVLGSYCLTEPSSGSDAAALRTTATKKGAAYLLNGSKAFVSGGGETDLLAVMVRTGGESAKGISCFVVPAHTPGISYGENEKKLGWKSQPTRIINFDNVEVSEDNMLGNLNEGFKIAMKGLDGGRVNIGTCSVGAAQAAINHCQRYMGERKQFGKTLASFQALQFRMADMATELVSARQMIRLAAWKVDRSDPNANVYCAMAKRLATDIGFEVCNQAMQIFGGYGYTQEYPLERLMRDSRVHQILEGTNEIMRIIVSKKILEDGALEQIR